MTVVRLRAGRRSLTGLGLGKPDRGQYYPEGWKAPTPYLRLVPEPSA